jgi:hypothetical protein
MRSVTFALAGWTATWLAPIAYAAPLVHWKFDETSGTTAADSAGVAQNGTLTNANAGSGWTTGLFGNAYSFAGGDTNEFFGTAIASNTGPYMSMSGWVNKTAAGNGAFGSLRADGSDFNIHFSSRVSTVLNANKRNGAADITATATTVVNNGQWNHVAVTVDWVDSGNNAIEPAEQKRRLYVNGVLDLEFQETVSRSTYNRLHAGALVRGNGTSVLTEFTGMLDDFAYWHNEAIDGVEVALIHGLGRFSLVTLDDASIANVRAAWMAGAGNSATSGAQTWHFASGLTGVTGTTGGTVAGGDAFIVLDGTNGTGVSLIPEPGSLATLAAAGLLLRRRRAKR